MPNDQCHIRGRGIGLLGPTVQPGRDDSHTAQLSGRDVAARAQDAHLAPDHIELDHWPRSARSQVERQDGLARLILLRFHHVRCHAHWHFHGVVDSARSQKDRESRESTAHRSTVNIHFRRPSRYH